MAKDYETERAIVRYLLGELSGRERAEFEEAYLADDRLFDEVRAVEDELYDDYVQGSLAKRERRLFEQNLLRSHGAARRLAFSRAFDDALARPLPPKAVEGRGGRRQPVAGLFGFRHARLLFASALIAVALLTLVAALLFFNARRSSPDEAGQAARTSPEPTPAASPPPGREAGVDAPGEGDAHDAPTQHTNVPPANRTDTHGAAALAFTLRPAGTRGGSGEGAGVLTIPRATRVISLRLGLGAGEYASYRAVIRTAEGVEVLNVSALRPRPARGGKVISVEVPAGRLAEGDYTLTLGGLEAPGRYADVEDFYFSVVRK